MKKLLYTLLLLGSYFTIYAQSNVGIGTDTPHPSAKLEIESTTQGLLIPRMTCNERDLIVTPAEGLLVYITDTCANGDLPGFFFFDGGLIWKPIFNITNLTAHNTLNEAYDEGVGDGAGRIITADAGAVRIIASDFNDALDIVNTGTSDGIDVTVDDGIGIDILTTDGTGIEISTSDGIGMNINTVDAIGIDVSTSDATGVTITTDEGRGLEVTNVVGDAKDLIYSENDALSTSDQFAKDGHPGTFINKGFGDSKSAILAVSETDGSGVVGATKAIPATFSAEEYPPKAGVLGISFTADDRFGIAGISKVSNGAYGRSEKENTWSEGPGHFGGFRAGAYGIGEDIGAVSITGVVPLRFGVIGNVSTGIGVFGYSRIGGHGVTGMTKGSSGSASQAGVWGVTQDAASWALQATEFPFLDLAAPKGSVGVLAQSKGNVASWSESQTDIGLVVTTGAKKGVADLIEGTAALYAISTQGDVSTAILLQEGESDKPAVKIVSKSMEAGILLEQGGKGMGMHLKNYKPFGPLSTSKALWIENLKGGTGVHFENKDTMGTGVALLVNNAGEATAGEFLIEDNDANMAPALVVSHKGSGGAAIFQIDDNDSGALSNGSPGVLITSDGKGAGLRVEIENTLSTGVDINSEPGIDVSHKGMGHGIKLETTNLTNDKIGLDVSHKGIGSSIYAVGDNPAQGAVLHVERTGSLASTGSDKGMVAHFDYTPAGTGPTTTSQAVLISTAAMGGPSLTTPHAGLRVTVPTGTAALAAAFEGKVEVAGALKVVGGLDVDGTIGTFGDPVSTIFSSTLSTGHIGGTTASFSGLVAAGSFFSPAKAFKIDHPLDPDNKYLMHMAIESDEYMNLYSGNIVTDSDGYATVKMPDFMNALNENFRYNLTVIGQTFAQAIVWEEMNDSGEFVIKTNEPGITVSWQITGVRHDEWVLENPLQVESDKKGEDIGSRMWSTTK